MFNNQFRRRISVLKNMKMLDPIVSILLFLYIFKAKSNSYIFHLYILSAVHPGLTSKQFRCTTLTPQARRRTVPLSPLHIIDPLSDPLLPRYASLYFCLAVENQENELLALEVIHRYVELLDKYFGNVFHSLTLHAQIVSLRCSVKVKYPPVRSALPPD